MAEGGLVRVGPNMSFESWLKFVIRSQAPPFVDNVQFALNTGRSNPPERGSIDKFWKPQRRQVLLVMKERTCCNAVF